MLTWTFKEAEENLLTLIANAALGNIQKIDFDKTKSVFVLSERYFKTLLTKAELADANNDSESALLNPNQLHLIS